MNEPTTEEDWAAVSGIPAAEVHAAVVCANCAIDGFMEEHPTVGLSPQQWDDLKAHLFSAMLGVLAAKRENAIN
jgi:hypothetical protein